FHFRHVCRMIHYFIFLSYFLLNLSNVTFSLKSISFQPNTGISSLTLNNGKTSRSYPHEKTPREATDHLSGSSDTPTDQLFQRSFFMNDMIESHQGPESNIQNHLNQNDHPLFVRVKIWNMVNGQLQLVGEQPVPIEAFHNSDLTNGAVVNPHDVPEDILDAVYQGVGNHPLLNPSLYRSIRKRRNSLDTNGQNDNSEFGKTNITAASVSKKKARTIVDGSINDQEPPVIHFIMPQVNDQYQHTLKSYLQTKLEEQNALNQNSNIQTRIRDHISPTPKALSHYRNANIPNIAFYGGVGSDNQEITAGPSYRRPQNNRNSQSSFNIPRPSSTPRNISHVLGGVGNRNNNNLPLGVGTSLNTSDLTYLQVLSQLANNIKSTENKNIDISDLLGILKVQSQTKNGPQFYSAGNFGSINPNIKQYFSTTTSAPVENRGSILELLPSNLPHINPLVSQQLQPSQTPVNLAAVLGLLPSPTTLQQEQLKVHLATITGTNTFAGHAGNQGLLNNNQHAAQNSANGNYGSLPSFQKVTSNSNINSGNPNIPTVPNNNRLNSLLASKQGNKLLATLLASQLNNFSSHQLNTVLNNVLTSQTNNKNPVSSNSSPSHSLLNEPSNNHQSLFQNPNINQFNSQRNPSSPILSPNNPTQTSNQNAFSSFVPPSHSLLNKPSVNHHSSFQNPNNNQFNSQRNPSSPNLSLNNPTLSQLLAYLSKIRSQSHLNNQNIRPSNLFLQRPSPISGIAQPPSSPFSQNSQTSSITNPLSPLAHISQLGSDISPSTSIDLSALTRPTLLDPVNAPTNTVPRTVTTTSIQDCLKESLCALGLAAFISLAITKTLAIPFIAPAFFGRRRRNLDVISTLIENSDNFIENTDTNIEESDRVKIIEMLSLFITKDMDMNSASFYSKNDTIDHQTSLEKVKIIRNLTINDIQKLIVYSLNFISSGNLMNEYGVIRYDDIQMGNTINNTVTHSSKESNITYVS
ncbi:unnamed protein product, partial [Meganyctiphanes norvegica]